MVKPCYVNLSKMFGVEDSNISFAANIDDKESFRGILEFTINLPHGKMSLLSPIKQEQRLLQVVREGLSACDMPLEFTHYFENCRDGIIHIHGCVEIKNLIYIEGLIQTFVKGVLRAVDGRLKYRPENYYPRMERYRSPMMCVQYTDEADRIIYWKQYITKCVQN